MGRLFRAITGAALARAGLVALATLCALTLVQRARVLWPFTVDDTYITLQYARHLAAGHGPTWNVGGPPAEGYTTVLWMLVLTAVERLGSDGVAGAKWLSAGFLVLSVGLSSALAFAFAAERPAWLRTFAASVPLACFCAYWKPAVHAVSGMETTLTAALLTGLALALTRFAAAPPVRARAIALTGLLLALARPEAALVAAVGWLAVALRAPAAARRTLVRVTLVYALVPGALYYAARYAYFGLPFPLPFYVKAQGHGGLAGLPDVAAFFGDFVRQRVVLVVLFAAGAVEARRVALPALFGSLALALFFTVPSHIMGFESRYLMPLVPVLFAFAGAGAAGILGYGLARFPAQPGAQAGVAAAAYAGLALLAALPFPSGYDQSVAHWRAYGAGLDSAHLALAADLRSHGGLAAQRVIALLDVGAVAYRSDFRVIDTYGLNDARVALSRRSDVAYVFAQQPDLVVVISERPDAAVPVFAWEAPILQMAHARGFTPVASYPFEHDYHLRLYARAGTPLAAAFLRTNRGQSSVLGGS